MPLTVTMNAEKTTKNGFVRFGEAKTEGDPHGKNIYLSPADVTSLGSPKAIKVTIEPA